MYEVTPSIVARKYVVYKHLVAGQVLFIGTCRYAELFMMEQARHNDQWVKLINPDTSISIEIVTIHDNSADATTSANELIERDKPYCNIAGKTFTRYTPVRCIEDGLVHENASIACRYYGISRQSMSNHLNKRPGYMTVGNRRFERVM